MLIVANWTFLTNHARVLLCIAHDPGARLRDIAAGLGITERSAYGIVTDLAEAGNVVKQKTAAATDTRSRRTCRSRTHPPGTHRRRSPGPPCRHRRRGCGLRRQVDEGGQAEAVRHGPGAEGLPGRV